MDKQAASAGTRAGQTDSKCEKDAVSHGPTIPVWLHATESFYKKLNSIAKQCELSRYDALSRGLDALLREHQIQTSPLNKAIKSPGQSEVFRRTMGQVSRKYWATVSVEEKSARGQRSALARSNGKISVDRTETALKLLYSSCPFGDLGFGWSRAMVQRARDTSINFRARDGDRNGILADCNFLQIVAAVGKSAFSLDVSAFDEFAGWLRQLWHKAPRQLALTSGILLHFAFCPSSQFGRSRPNPHDLGEWSRRVRENRIESSISIDADARD